MSDKNNSKKQVLSDKARNSSMIIFIFLNVVTFVIAVIVFLNYNNYLTCNDYIKNLIYIGASGTIGAVVTSFRSLVLHVSKKDFDTDFNYWYFFRPILGLILGTFSYLIIKGGLLTISVDGIQNDS